MPPSGLLTSCSGQAAGWRRYSASELLPIAAREAIALGAARPSDLSGLDQLNTPCWQVIRPEAIDVSGNVTVLSGKGWQPEAAQLGAFMEFLERHWAERSQVPVVIAKPSDWQRLGEYYLPLAVVPLPLHVADPGDVPLAWVRGTTLDGRSIWVPAHEVFCPFQPVPGSHNPNVWHSGGLAAGSNWTEAVFHGLLEIAERDAVAVAELGGCGVTVDLENFGSLHVQLLIKQMRTEGLCLEVKQLSPFGGLHAHAAFIEDSASGNPLRLNGGYGAHVDPFLSIESCILEAVQTRASFIAGGREDLAEFSQFAALGYDRARAALSWWLDPTPDKVPAPRNPLPRTVDVNVVITSIAETLRQQLFCPVIYVPLSPPDASIKVVRVLIPSASYATPGNIRLGRRFAPRGLAA